MAHFAVTIKDHALNRIDARVKLLFCLAALIMVLSCRGVFFPLLVFSLCVALSAWMRVPLKVFLLRFSEPFFIAGVLVLLKFLFSGHETLVTVAIAGIEISGYRDGLLDGLHIAARIAGAVSLVAVLGFSTPFTDFVAALSWCRVPKGLVEIFLFAYRYIFVLFEDAMVIYSAQKNRLGYSSIRRGLNSFGVLAGSLVLKAFEHSENVTTAMVQRGYDGNLPLLRQRPLPFSEILGSLLCITALGVVWRL